MSKIQCAAHPFQGQAKTPLQRPQPGRSEWGGTLGTRRGFHSFDWKHLNGRGCALFVFFPQHWVYFLARQEHLRKYFDTEWVNTWLNQWRTEWMNNPTPRAHTKAKGDSQDYKHLWAPVTCQSFRRGGVEERSIVFAPLPARTGLSWVPQDLHAACYSPGRRLLSNPNSRIYFPSLPIKIPTSSVPWNVTGWHEEKHLINQVP